MSTTEEQDLPKLYKRLRDVERLLAERNRVLWKERELLLEAIAEKTPATTGKYAKFTGKKKAIQQSVKDFGRFVSKQEIIDDLTLGGLPNDPVAGADLINDAINYQLDTKDLVTVDGKPLTRAELKGRTLLVGFPEFRGASSR